MSAQEARCDLSCVLRAYCRVWKGAGVTLDGDAKHHNLQQCLDASGSSDAPHARCTARGVHVNPEYDPISPASTGGPHARYAAPVAYDAAFAAARGALLEAFLGPPACGVYSPSVQYTLFQMGGLLLER